MAACGDGEGGCRSSPVPANEVGSVGLRLCGFGEIDTFNRAFRRRFGGTPSALREGTLILTADFVFVRDPGRREPHTRKAESPRHCCRGEPR
jgi:hypothetical protein